MKWCPACRRGWPDGHEVCGACLAALVDDLAATVRCRYCNRDWPARMQSCPQCLAELRPDPEAALEAMAEIVERGGRAPRPAGRPPFALGVACTLLRLAPHANLLYTGPDEFVEAAVHDRVRCEDEDGRLLFRLIPYEAAARALVALDGGGAALATFIPRAGGLDVRDETSAPAARLRRAPGGFSLVETGGGEVASVLVRTVPVGTNEEWLDQQWELLPSARRLPLRPLAAVALLLAGRTLLGCYEAKPATEKPTDVVTPETVT